MSQPIKEATLSAVEIRDNLTSWELSRRLLSDSHFFINELGFYNKVEDSTVEAAYRADLVLASDKLVGFEIKSEKDTLKRWEAQKQAYTNVFNEVWLCCHHKHSSKAIANTPDHIGLLVVDDANNIELVRKAVIGHGLNNTYDLSSMLWREELDELGALHGIKWKSRTNKKEVREILAVELTLDTVMDFVIHKLNIRKNEVVV